MKNFLKSGNWEADGHVIAIGGTKYQIAPANLVQVRNGEETEFFTFHDACAVADELSLENEDKVGGWRMPTLTEMKLIEAYTAEMFQCPAGVSDAKYGLPVKDFVDTLGLSLPGNLLIVGAVCCPNHDDFTGYWMNPIFSPAYVKFSKKHVSYRNVDPDDYCKKTPEDDDNPFYHYALCIRLIREIID